MFTKASLAAQICCPYVHKPIEVLSIATMALLHRSDKNDPNRREGVLEKGGHKQLESLNNAILGRNVGFLLEAESLSTNKTYTSTSAVHCQISNFQFLNKSQRSQ